MVSLRLILYIRLGVEDVRHPSGKFLKEIVLVGLLCCLFAVAVACRDESVVAPFTSTTATPPVSSTPTFTPSVVRPIPSTTPAPTVSSNPTSISSFPDSYFSPCGPHHFPVAYHSHFLDWSSDGSLLLDFDEKIWIIHDDGTFNEIVDPDPLDKRNAYGFYADFSPTSDQIVYSTCQYPTNDGPLAISQSMDSRYEGYEIATINIDGTAQQRLTVNNHLDHYPVWSPDGGEIVFVGSHGPTADYDVGTAGLFSLSEDGEHMSLRRMTSIPCVALYPPLWSPDGQLLVVSSFETGPWPYNSSFWTVKSDGSERRKIGESTILPTWSPNSDRLAFVEFYRDDAATIYTIRYDGTDLQEIWDSGPDGHYPPITSIAWSPDGLEILVVSSWLWTIQADGSGTRVLGPKDSPFWLEDAVWSPDGSKVAARGSEHPQRWFGPFGVIVMGADGSDLRILVAEDENGVLHKWDAIDDS